MILGVLWLAAFVAGGVGLAASPRRVSGTVYSMIIVTQVAAGFGLAVRAVT